VAGRVLTVGTRGSALALEQARRVRLRLPGTSELRVVHTGGDRFTEAPLGEQNAAGFFTREIEEELLSGAIDLAVHSLKDLPTKLAPGLAFGAMLPRDDPADILLVRPEAREQGSPLPLKKGAVMGVSSQRRSALLRHFRPDLSILPIRGNVPTRVDKVQRGDFDAILLSRAGLERLKLDVNPLLCWELNPRSWPGAPGQGVIAVEVRQDDQEVMRHVSAMNDAATFSRVQAERSLLVAFGGGCHSPFGAYCEAGPGVCLVVVAAPGTAGGFMVERFSGTILENVRSAAEAWVLSARAPLAREKREEEWLCRPALPWC
jgi:hydroxymethylbilane synthase